MKEYYWDAIHIETGDEVGGGVFAPDAKTAAQQLESYGLYRDIIVRECHVQNGTLTISVYGK